MFNKKAMVLVCGGAPSMAPNAPASPGAGGGVGESSGGSNGNNNDGGGVFAPKASGLFSERPRPLIGGGPLRALIGPWEGSPRALIGCAAEGEGEQPKWRPASLPLPEGELDGCDEAEAEDEVTVPSSTPSPDKEMAEEEEKENGKGGPALFPDQLRKTTLEVVGRYLREAADEVGPKGSGPKFSLQGLLGRFGSSPDEAEVARALETLRRVGESLREKHLLAFQGMLRKLEIKKEEDLTSVSEVATEVFRDGIINWGRIVTLISFGAFVAKHLKSINQENGINTLIEIITDVLVTDKREWLLKHNAWEGFVQFFHVEDIEGGIRNVLVAFASVAGIGAGLAYMIR